METVLLRVAEHGGGFRVELLRRDPTTGWSDEPEASEPIPADLRGAVAPPALSGPDLCVSIRDFVRDNPQSGEFEAIGGYLAELLLCGTVRAAWTQLRSAQRNAGAGLRTLLQVEPERLSGLPWELLCCEEEYLFADAENPVARVLAMDREAGPEQLLPIRMLVVEGERNAQLGTDRELRAIKQALAGCGGRIDAEFLTAPSWDCLLTTYRRVRPHIFHFIGHGETVPGDNEDETALRVFQPGTPAWPLTREHLLALLKPMPRLVVLNACRSGVGAPADPELGQRMRDLGEALLAKKAAAAVVGMQGDVQGRAAARFGGALYDALADRKLIDEAVTHAREELFATVGVTRQERDWFLPQLTLRVEPELVFPMRCLGDADERDSVVDQVLTPQVTPFVNRVRERHDVVAGLEPETGQPARLLVVTGDSGSGKTHLLHWIRRRCVLRGQRVRYIDFRGQSSAEFHHALYIIRDAAEDVARAAANAAAFRQFNHDIPFLAAGRVPEVLAGQPPIVAVAPRPVFHPGLDDQLEQAVDSFVAGLNNLATEASPLVLILDHLDGLHPGGFQNVLHPLLIRRVAETRDVPHVRLVVALSSEQRTRLWPQGGTLGTKVTLNQIKSCRFGELFEDFLLEWDRSIADDAVRWQQAQELGAKLQPWVTPAWQPRKFEGVRMFLEDGR